MCRRLTFEQLVQLLVLVLLFAAIFGLFAAVLALGHAVQQTMQQTGRAIQGSIDGVARSMLFQFPLSAAASDCSPCSKKAAASGLGSFCGSAVWVLIRVAFAVKTVQFVVSHAVV
mmetsp:Transcript_59180/g.138507  ORF Transcript_59180/g.138507 Transcript_59180/m.138507 type:complete len:115 (+) Transcript_59180:91-435(+)